MLSFSFGGNLRYCQTQGCFYLYEYKGKGLWTQLSDIEIKGEIKNKFNGERGSAAEWLA